MRSVSDPGLPAALKIRIYAKELEIRLNHCDFMMHLVGGDMQITCLQQGLHEFQIIIIVC